MLIYQLPDRHPVGGFLFQTKRGATVADNKQIVSKRRIADHGEVFTAPREVNAMLDLVKQETQRIDSRFLEPACGKGAFLTEILRRKLEIVNSRYRKSQIEYERYMALAVSSIYGIDILPDNVADCRSLLLGICIDNYASACKLKCACIPTDFIETLRFILDKNIVLGDALTLKRVDGSNAPIVFSEWSLVMGDMFKRRDFYFSSLVDSEMGGEYCRSDMGGGTWMPVPVREFPLTHYKRLKDAE